MKKMLGIVAGIAVLSVMMYSCSSGPLVLQPFDYTENPVDIPNPDRGFYRANDGMVVPVSGTEDTSMNVGGSVNLGTDSPVITATSTVSHVYFDLRRYSSNAIQSRPDPWFDADYLTNNGLPSSNQAEVMAGLQHWLDNVVAKTPKGMSGPITADGLAYIRECFDKVRDANATLMVRFNYMGMGWTWIDTTVNGIYIDQLLMDNEPDKETILGHIAQLKPILHDYEDVIMGVDGGFFGPWGEMHSTTFGTDPEAYAWLLEALLDAVPESRSITVHAGAFLSWYNRKYGTSYNFTNIDKMPSPKRGRPESRFGFFNDSYAYGEDEGDDYPNDWGSLSEGVEWLNGDDSDEDDYDRGRVMTWIRKQNNLYGGEAQGDETLWNTFPFVAWEASYAQTVYLNADYEEEVHDRWKDFIYTKDAVEELMTNSYNRPYKYDHAIFDPVYEGRRGLEYWRDRLGYRLVLRKAQASGWVKRNGTLHFKGKIQNVGFGNVVNKKNVKVILKSKSDYSVISNAVSTNLDARDWRPHLDSRASNTKAWRNFSFKIPMREFGNLPIGEYAIYLKINDPKEQSVNKRSIRFANKGNDIWDSNLGANLIGSVTIKE